MESGNLLHVACTQYAHSMHAVCMPYRYSSGSQLQVHLLEENFIMELERLIGYIDNDHPRWAFTK